MDQDILDQAMKTCRVIQSPTFSQASEPNFELYDPADRMISLPEDPISTQTKTQNNLSTSTTLSTQAPPTSVDTSTIALPDQVSQKGVVSIQRVQDTDPVESYTTSTVPFNPPSPPSTLISTDLSTQTPSTRFQDASTQTGSLEKIVQANMKDMMGESFKIFAQVLGEKFATYHPTEALQGIQSALACQNQNMLQLAQCIEKEVLESRKQHLKLGENPLASAISTLTKFVDDLRTDFPAYTARPASESHHQRTSQALESVVSGINTLLSTIRPVQQTQSRPAQPPNLAQSLNQCLSPMCLLMKPLSSTD